MAKSPLATSKKQRINSSVEIPDMEERRSLCQIGRQGQPLSPDQEKMPARMAGRRAGWHGY
jgi:hypothetical protein